MNNNVMPIGNQMSAGWFDFFIVLGAIALVALITLLWAVFIRKAGKPRRKHRHHHATYRERFRKNAAEIRQLVQPQQRTRSERHPLNPTLAETGGLPPVRHEEKSPGQAPPTSQL